MRAFLSIVCLTFPAMARADVRLPKIFTAGAVLQQELPLPVWGWADAGEAVEVHFAGKSASTKAGEDGRWRVDLPAMRADGRSHVLIVKGKNTVELKDIMLGEVWLSVGQSNMSRGLRYVKERVKAEPMDFPNLRLFFVDLDQVPQREEPAVTKGWAPATHASMNEAFLHPKLGPYEYSEVTYYFGKAVHESLGVPVGMISAAYPGSTVAQWTPADDPAGRFDFAAGKPDKGPGSMWQSMLIGLPPLAISGVIYYQGENDAGNVNYEADLAKMLAAWRGKFGRPDMPFYMAQIAQTTFGGGMLRVWEAQQRLAAGDPHVAVASSNDLWDGGNPEKAKAKADVATGWPIVGGGDPHPPNKHVIAARLARVALGRTYGKIEGEACGPTVLSHEARPGVVAVKFRNAGKGLKTDDGEAPNWFQVAGADKHFVKAQAKIVGPDTIELRAAGVEAPTHFRFARHALARHNLYNADGLPAISYRSDDGAAPATRPPTSQPAPAAATAPERPRAEAAKKPDPPQPTHRTERKILGWTVRVDDRLLSGSDEELGQRSLKFLEAKLDEITVVVPPQQLEKLRGVTIVVDLSCGSLRSMQYHPSAGWLKANGFPESLAKCVHIPQASDLRTKRNISDQPWVVLHELSHAYHDQVLGFDEPRVLEAYKRFKELGHGEKALLYNGRRVRHYGLTDQKEFFAEMTEAYFGANDFYPFNRAEIMESDPELHALLSTIWGGKK